MDNMQRQHFLRNMKKYSGTVSVRRRIPDLRRSIVRRLISTALGIVMIILSGCSFSVPVREEESIDSTAIVRAEWNTEQTKETEIYVHVCGCVKKPGVYSLHFGARTQEAINAAGGFSEKANQTAWNLAEVLQDGMQIYVPSKDEAKEALNEEQSLGKDLSASQKEDTVNINTASKEELMTLPGIGESRADAVIACREEKGSFTSIEGIKDAAGIGDGIFNRIKDLITVN